MFPSASGMISVPAQHMVISIPKPSVWRDCRAGAVPRCWMSKPLTISLAAVIEASRGYFPSGPSCVQTILIFSIDGTVAGSIPFFTINHDQCMRYARSGGRYVAEIVTLAPASRKASMNASTLSRKGHRRSRSDALPLYLPTHCLPLRSIYALPTAPLCRVIQFSFPHGTRSLDAAGSRYKRLLKCWKPTHELNLVNRKLCYVDR